MQTTTEQTTEGTITMHTSTEPEVRSMKQIDAETFHGTVKQFVDAGLKVNGSKIDNAGLSVFGRYNMFKVVGEQKPARGRSAAVYEVKLNQMFSF